MTLIKKIIHHKYLIDFLIFSVFMLFSGFLSLQYGVERTYDTRNYHIYNPWAFLTGRIGYDIMPGGIQSYFNPFLDVPYYLAIKYLNDYPVLITFFMGFSFALFLFMVYKTALLVFKDYHPIVLATVCVFLASENKMNLRCLGWLSHDIFLGDLILLSLYLIFKGFDKYSLRNFGLSGLILGACVGLKYTTAVFAVPLGIIFLLFYKRYQNPLKTFFFFCLGGLVGFLLTGGIWMSILYYHFKNPTFPYFNWLFNSPEIASTDVFTSDFGRMVSKSLKKNWLGPLVTEPYDLSHTILWVAFFVNFALFPFVNRKKFKEWFKIDAGYADFALLFCFFSHGLWAHTFATYRYYAPILGLTAIVAIIVFFKVLYILKTIYLLIFKKAIISGKKTAVVSFALLLCFCSYLTALLWPHYITAPEKKLVRVSIGQKILDVENLQIPDNAIVLLGEGTGIILPFQNPNAKYIKINPLEFSRVNKKLFSEKNINLIKSEIKAKNDKIFTITNFDIMPYTRANIAAIRLKQLEYLNKNEHWYLSPLASALLEMDELGIDIEKYDCREIKSNMIDVMRNMQHQFYFCKFETQ